jgi:cyclophilin family peptidyl-prolyl cis-trans isomerase
MIGLCPRTIARLSPRGEPVRNHCGTMMRSLHDQDAKCLAVEAKEITRMHSAFRYAIAWSLMLTMIAAVGCGSGSDKEAETEPDPETQQPAETGDGTSASTPVQPPPGPREPGPPSKPRVLIETSKGSITVELNREKAVNTVDNFLRYVRDEHYNNTIFHEVMKDYVVIGGSFTRDLQERQAGVAIRNEARNGMSNIRGTIAMSRQTDEKNSATCQFFFNLADNSGLLDHKEAPPEGETADQDYGYCVFGKVVEGMTVVDAIGNAELQARGDFETIPVEDVVIRSMRELR